MKRGTERITDHFANSIQAGDIFACFGADAVSRFISFETSLLSDATGKA